LRKAKEENELPDREVEPTERESAFKREEPIQAKAILDLTQRRQPCVAKQYTYHVVTVSSTVPSYNTPQ